MRLYNNFFCIIYFYFPPLSLSLFYCYYPLSDDFFFPWQNCFCNIDVNKKRAQYHGSVKNNAHMQIPRRPSRFLFYFIFCLFVCLFFSLSFFTNNKSIRGEELENNFFFPPELTVHDAFFFWMISTGNVWISMARKNSNSWRVQIAFFFFSFYSL